MIQNLEENLKKISESKDSSNSLKNRINEILKKCKELKEKKKNLDKQPGWPIPLDRYDGIREEWKLINESIADDTELSNKIHEQRENKKNSNNEKKRATVKKTRWKRGTDEKCEEGDGVNPKHYTSPRVAFWYGKVNQYYDIETYEWRSDPDGVSGAKIRDNNVILSYCKSIYGDQVIAFEKFACEEITSWKKQNNWGEDFTASKWSYKCIISN
ncbi:MAG: hypothetical protein KDD52_06200 [Bdellovibrionales bacterium]|nr:hypothetical protein [Bdellovibrionales bacterium]